MEQTSVSDELSSTQWCGGPLSYASVVMSARDTQCSWTERQQRMLVDAADGDIDFYNFDINPLTPTVAIWVQL